MLTPSVSLAVASIFKRGKSLARHWFKEFGETRQRCSVIVERSLSKGKRDREFESVQPSQREKQKILSERKNLHEHLDKEAD